MRLALLALSVALLAVGCVDTDDDDAAADDDDSAAAADDDDAAADDDDAAADDDDAAADDDDSASAPSTVDWYLDLDDDGWGDEAEKQVHVEGDVPNGTNWITEPVGDCDDLNSWVNPGLPELCDNRDNDCDGIADDTAPAWCTCVDAAHPSWNVSGDDFCAAQGLTCDQPFSYTTTAGCEGAGGVDFIEPTPPCSAAPSAFLAPAGALKWRCY